jgi:hypothetical protein
MARLPVPGSDDGTWGDILNDFLSQEHNADGTQKAIPESKITNLVSDLAGKQDAIAPGTYADAASTTAALTARARLDVPTVIDFPGAPIISHFNHGHYWETGVNLGKYMYGWWIMPRVNASPAYIVSDGYGSGHALLFGVQQNSGLSFLDPTVNVFHGNIYNGVTIALSYRADDGAAPGEWCWVETGWDGANIYIWLDGIIIGKIPYTDVRQSQPYTSGGGYFLIGGSDHQNFNGRIRSGRGFENLFPISSPQAAYYPEREPRNQWTPNGIDWYSANFMADYGAVQEGLVPDQSDGYMGRLHPGSRNGGGVVTFAGGLQTASSVQTQMPAYVNDDTAPFGSNVGLVTPTGLVPTVPTSPAGLKLWHHWCEAKQTPAFHGTTATWGQTKGGLLSARIWQAQRGSAWGGGALQVGIINGHGVITDLRSGVVWVDSGATDQDVWAKRRHTAQAGTHVVGIALRVVDRDQYYAIYTRGAIGSAVVRVELHATGETSSGTTLATYTQPNSTWKFLRATIIGTTLTIYIDNGSYDSSDHATGWIQIGQLSGQTAYSAATGVGIPHAYDQESGAGPTALKRIIEWGAA